jgi:hypothetical protein
MINPDERTNRDEIDSNPSVISGFMHLSEFHYRFSSSFIRGFKLFAHSNSSASPDFREVFEPLEIVFLLDPAFHTEFRENRHHLAYGKTGKLRGFS